MLGHVDVVHVVELLVLAGVLELGHVVEVLDAAVIEASDRLVQLLPSQGAHLQPGLHTHTAQGPVVASLEVLVVGEGVDAGHMLGDGEDHLDEELGIAVAGCQSVPYLVFHAPDPGPQRNALPQLRRLPQVLGHTLDEVPAVKVVNKGSVTPGDPLLVHVPHQVLDGARPVGGEHPDVDLLLVEVAQELLGGKRLHLGTVLHHALLRDEEVDHLVGRGLDEAENKFMLI